MKKKIIAALAAIMILVIGMTSCAFAGTWVYGTGGWWYLNDDSSYPVNTWQVIDEYWYHFNAAGYMDTGWFYTNGRWYYAYPGGEIATGWIKVGDSWYYMNDKGEMETGWMLYKGARYYLLEDGKMATGWEYINGAWYNFREDGSLILSAGDDDDGNNVQQYGSSTNWLIYVNTTTNMLYVYYGSYGNWNLMYSWTVSTGAPESPTVKGQFTVGEKGYSFGESYTCYYYTQFYGPYLFHSTKYVKDTFIDYDPTLGANVSAGCVRMAIENAKWIYYNIPYGTRVVVV